jgi:hypothetical protein
LLCAAAAALGAARSAAAEGANAPRAPLRQTAQAAPGVGTAPRAAPRPVPDPAAVEASFDAFASQWMDRMQRVEEEHRRAPSAAAGTAGTKVGYQGYSEEFTTELRATGHAVAPYVGLLRYEERTYSCVDAGATRCGITSRMPVTEIFRYQDGRWIY